VKVQGEASDVLGPDQCFTELRKAVHPSNAKPLKLTHLFSQETATPQVDASLLRTFVINLTDKVTPFFVNKTVRNALGDHYSVEPVEKLRNEVFVHVGEAKGEGRRQSTIEREAAAIAAPGDASATFVLLDESQKATYVFDGRYRLSRTSCEPRHSRGDVLDPTQVRNRNCCIQLFRVEQTFLRTLRIVPANRKVLCENQPTKL